MSDLSVFLLARIADDEAVVRENWHLEDAISDAFKGTLFQPSRMLAECQAKRLIIEDYLAQLNSHRSGWDIRSPRDYPIRALALAYAGHPDYRDEWRP